VTVKPPFACLLEHALTPLWIVTTRTLVPPTPVLQTRVSIFSEPVQERIHVKIIIAVTPLVTVPPRRRTQSLPNASKSLLASVPPITRASSELA
jgi:hypothetical protein